MTSVGHQGATISHNQLEFDYFLPREVVYAVMCTIKKICHKISSKVMDVFGPVKNIPLMELPPLSPGIQARVMDEVEVVETVRRG